MSSPEIILSSSLAQDSSSATSAAIPIPSRSTNSWGDLDFSMSNTGLYTPSYVGSFGSAQESVLSNWGNNEDQSSLNPLSSDMDMQDPTTRLFESLDGGDDYVPDYDVDNPSTSPFHMIEQDFNTLSGAAELGFSEDISQVKSAVPGSAGIYAGDLFSNQQDMGMSQVYSNVSPSSSLNDLHRERELHNRSRASSSASSFQDHPSPSPSFGMSHDFSTSNQINEQLGRLTFDQSYSNITTSTPDLSHTTPSPPGASSPQIQPPISPPHLIIPGDSSAASVPPILAGNLPPFGPPQNIGPGGPSIEILPATPVNTTDAATRNTLHFLLHNRSNASNGPVVDSRGRQSFIRNNAFQASARAGNVNTDQTSDSAATDNAVWDSVTAFGQQSKNTALGSGASAVDQAPTTLPQPTSYHHGYNIPALPAFNPPESSSSKSQQQGSEPAPINLPSLPPFSHHQSAPAVGPSDPNFNNILYSRPDLGQPQPSPSSPDFLLPAQGHSRSRSFSDTSSRPSPSFWDPSLTSTTMNTHDFSRPSTSSSISSSHYGMMAQPSLNMPDMTHSMDVPMDTSMNFLPNSNSPSRSNSMRHKRGVKSEDLTPLRSPALMQSVLAPEADYIKSIKIDGSLAPFDPRMSGDPSLGSGMYMSTGHAGPTRRRPSSSGHERVGSVTSLRATPYTRPSPHASPAPSPHHSPNMPGQNLPGVADLHSGNQHQSIQPVMKVERALVTTPATKTASANRRRAEASFVCPVPGCGSTFTRHFNLRGHLRSHNEERPFKCKWPGCEKGFARQHDCKRHEALHLNIRPYTCEGCQKTFARMDALNRHLRSEGGIDCQKHHKLEGLTSFGSDSNDPIQPKQEPEWSGKRGGIMM